MLRNLSRYFEALALAFGAIALVGPVVLGSAALVATSIDAADHELAARLDGPVFPLPRV